MESDLSHLFIGRYIVFIFINSKVSWIPRIFFARVVEIS